MTKSSKSYARQKTSLATIAVAAILICAMGSDSAAQMKTAPFEGSYSANERWTDREPARGSGISPLKNTFEANSPGDGDVFLVVPIPGSEAGVEFSGPELEVLAGSSDPKKPPPSTPEREGGIGGTGVGPFIPKPLVKEGGIGGTGVKPKAPEGPTLESPSQSPSGESVKPD